jgi:hypothetical protein
MSEKQGVWQVIPTPAKVIGAVVTICMTVVARLFLLPSDPKMSQWQPWQMNMFCLIFLVLFFYVLLVGYVYGDAKRRGMRYVMWTLLAIFIPNAIGIVLYFVLRDPLPSPCQTCGRSVPAGFAYCPKCGTLIKRVCDGCGRAVETDWMNCAYCGKKLGSSATGASVSTA